MIDNRCEGPQPFVSAGFTIPEVLETPEFRLRMLTINDLVKDYDAVMSSVEHLKQVWPGSGWPEGLTLEDDLIDLGWHQHEFLARASFAYTVVTPDESKVLGCVYINPTRKPGYDAEVYLWVRSSELESGLDDRLFTLVKAWLEEIWPFKTVGFPGRSVDSEVWSALSDEKK